MFRKLFNAPKDHPKVQTEKIGVLLGNLGTPGATDYWSVRKYLKEFLSDRRVIDYSPWIWQPILSLILLRRPFSSGASYKEIWNHEKDESPLLTITREHSLFCQRFKSHCQNVEFSSTITTIRFPYNIAVANSNKQYHLDI